MQIIFYDAVKGGREIVDIKITKVLSDFFDVLRLFEILQFNPLSAKWLWGWRLKG